MSEQYRFFDSVDGEDERFYTADEFAEYFRKFIRNGIFSGGDNLKVDAEGIDMNVKVKEGYAWIEGYLYKVDIEPLSLTLGAADPTLNRIDRIVIRLDRSLEKRYVKAFILKGAPAENPIPPELTRDENIHEIALAQIEVIGGKSFIENHQITDERLNGEVCGIVTHLFEQIDTREIFNEWQNYLADKKNRSNLDYESFIDQLQLNLNNFLQIWENWFTDIKDVTNLTTKEEFNTLNEMLDLHKSNYASTDILGHVKGEVNGDGYLKANSIQVEDGKFTSTNVENVLGELFTNVSNGKNLISGAITDVDNNIVIPANPTFGDLSSLIRMISTGRKWASGSHSNSSRSSYVTASNLDFTPSIIIAQSAVWLGNYSNYYMPCAFYTSFISNIYSFYGNRYQDEGKEGSMTWRAVPFSTTSKLSSGYSYDNGFKINLNYNGDYTFRWYAFE